MPDNLAVTALGVIIAWMLVAAVLAALAAAVLALLAKANADPFPAGDDEGGDQGDAVGELEATTAVLPGPTGGRHRTGPNSRLRLAPYVTYDDNRGVYVANGQRVGDPWTS